jgi:hypothetical protein
MPKVDRRADLWAGRANAKKACATQSKLEINAPGLAIAVDELHYSVVPTSAKQVELRARYEAAQSLLDQCHIAQVG